MRFTRSLAGLALLAISLPAFGWNLDGHRIIAGIAYARLKPKARARVDALIRRHPDYETLLTKDAPADPAARARYAFMNAAAWPDMIRGDARFYDETRADAVVTPPIPGFPESKRHPTWHYYDIPYSPDGTPGESTPPPNAFSELQRLIPEIGSTKDDALAAYDLPWIEHLVGDVHQPLHATSRYLKTQPKGDAGGNFVWVVPGKPLHAYWDDAAGTELNQAQRLEYGVNATRQHKQPWRLSLTPKDWIDESYALVKSDVYSFGPQTGSREMPLTLPAGYAERTQAIAKKRIALAAYRLAQVLNRQLR
ncbi:MAG: S1/P1 nuclease [Bryobacteraceae bacterium]